MRLTLEIFILAFVITVFTPSLFYVCNAEEPVDPIVDENIKAEKIALKTHDRTVQEEEIAISDDGFSVADRKLLREEPHKFQAEIHRLMGIIINSLYSNRDIFIRELISNAADALGKAHFLSLTDPTYLKETTTLEIKIKADTEKGLLHIRDTGIGMTKQELINNLGSIAKSGTKEFLEKMSSSSDISQIGQFGVGFYSSFLVADKVTVTSKHNDDEQYIWECGIGEDTSFHVAKDPRGNTLGRGTLITLHIKEDAKQFLQTKEIKELVLKYNEFISYPIYLWNSHEEEREVPKAPEKEEEVKETDEDISVKEDDEEETEEPTPKTEKIKETVWSWEHINTNPPLWTRNKSEISDEEYINFYKNVLKDSSDPLLHTHFKAEGDVEFTALLYVPETLPYGYWEPSYSPSLRLYVKRIFITDDFEDMLPSYLNFIKGVLDSDDLGLNVSREMLQQDKNLAVIKKKLVRKVLALFQELAEEDPEKYEKFYKSYSANIKVGLISDTQNRTRLSKLLRFYTAKNTEKQISLEDYVQKMKKGQKDIYYLGGETKEAILQSPLMERLSKRGYDVIIMPDAVDEYSVTTLSKFDGKFPFVDISKDGLKLEGDDEEKLKSLKEEYQPLCDYLKTVLEDKVSKVEVSNKLTRTPSAIVSNTYGYSANMERILKAQALRDPRFFNTGSNKRVLEINPRHPMIKKLLEDVNNDETSDASVDAANVLYDTAVLNSGFTVEKPKDLTSRVLKMVSKNLNIDPNEEVEEEIFEEEVEEEEEEEKEEEEEEEVTFEEGDKGRDEL